MKIAVNLGGHRPRNLSETFQELIAKGVSAPIVDAPNTQASSQKQQEADR